MMQKLINYGTKTILGLTLSGMLGCVEPVLAKRDYASYPQHKEEIAYYNLEHILADRCCEGLGESYPNCRTFKIDRQGFSCTQLWGGKGFVTSAFSWNEIQSIECKSQYEIKINGEYDSSTIWCRPRQCEDFKEAYYIFQQERRKH